ncbi:MAG TPA: diguanylate cyclase [Cycloclasticus sp.]|nr:diguanylate cyclase [Cycloclasticus sp.]HIL91856.1 diguanylate cyclase [Cycloclasticus sp.]
MMLKNLTSNWGFEPILVEDGEGAWDALQGENPPRILLLDWEMPKLDGVQLSQRIRENDTNDPPYIILLTGRSEAEDIAEGLAAGANDYLSKPFKKAELEACIKVGERLLTLQFEHIQALADAELAACVFTHALEGIVITDETGKIIDVNKTFSDITGYSREESINKNSQFLTPENHDDAWKAVLTTGQWSGEVWNKRKNGEAFVQQLTINTVNNEENHVKHYIGMFSDVTERARFQEELAYAANHDGLTNLANRQLLKDRLHQAMANTRRTGTPLAVVYLDLDGFKAVNDQFGHEQGDKVLVSLANHMNDLVRDTDTVARVGGDEFVVLLTGLTNNDGCELTLWRLLAAATTSVDIDGMQADVSASIGVSLFTKDDDITDEMLLDQADQAMYDAKKGGKNRYQFFGDKRLG